ncbi:11585_t:CDS:1, partial [Funneliformis geosporum]
MGELTINYALSNFFDIIIEKFLAEKIRFPNTELEINRITNEFKKFERISNIISAID